MKKIIILALTLATIATIAYAGTNITGQFSVDGTTIIQRPSGELYVAPSGLTTLATKSAFATYTGTPNKRPTYTTYSSGQAICWKANNVLGRCSTVPNSVGKCTCN